ncbi:hypothetical protein [Microbacterium sp. A94]|uniref:hypothetical protein n=1 Tax=Microbacterium sp. A94 TaxID=3450717 RepID=UPI003F41C913
MATDRPFQAAIIGTGGIAAGETTGDDPFFSTMSGDAVPWHPVKDRTEEAVS